MVRSAESLSAMDVEIVMPSNRVLDGRGWRNARRVVGARDVRFAILRHHVSIGSRRRRRPEMPCAALDRGSRVREPDARKDRGDPYLWRQIVSGAESPMV
jgi:hypothetical protein